METSYLTDVVKVGVNQDGYLEWLWEASLHEDLIVNKDNKDLLDEMTKCQEVFAEILIKLCERMDGK